MAETTVPINPVTGKSYATTDMNPATGKPYTAGELTQMKTPIGFAINPATSKPFAVGDGAVNPATGLVYTAAEIATMSATQPLTAEQTKAFQDRVDEQKRRDVVEVAAQENDLVIAQAELDADVAAKVKLRAARLAKLRADEQAMRDRELADIQFPYVPNADDSDSERALKALGAEVDRVGNRMIATYSPQRAVEMRAILHPLRPNELAVRAGVYGDTTARQAQATKAQALADEAMARSKADLNNQTLADAAKRAQVAADAAAKNAQIVGTPTVSTPPSTPAQNAAVVPAAGFDRPGARRLPDGTIVYPGDAAYNNAAALTSPRGSLPVSGFAGAQPSSHTLADGTVVLNDLAYPGIATGPGYPRQAADGAVTNPWDGVSTEDRINYEVDRLAALRRLL